MSEAFDILSDPKKRKVYDRFGEYSDNLANAAAAGATPGSTYTRGAPFDFSGFDWGAASSSAGSGGGSSAGAGSSSGGSSTARKRGTRPPSE